MVASLVLLLVYQLVGEVTVRFFDLDLPGPVLGMALLLLTLMARRRLSAALAGTTRGLLDNLGLLFVPAGAGLISQADHIRGHWLGLIATVVLSTLLTLVATGWTMKLMMRWTGTLPKPGEGSATGSGATAPAGTAPASPATPASAPAAADGERA